MLFKGSICALVSPFREDLSLDLDRFGGLVEWHCASGTAGIVVGGSTGESGALAAFELAALITRAIDVARGRLQVLVGAGGAATSEALAKAEMAKALGADGVLAVTPYYSRPTQAGLVVHFRALTKLGLPVVLYNVPSRTGCDLEPETVALLQPDSGIVAIKEARADPERMRALLALRRPGFSILSGDDPTCARSLLAGADGVISVVSNVAPRAMAELCHAAAGGDTAAVQGHDVRLQRLYEAAAVEPNPVPVKHLLAALGRIQNTLRLPLLPLSDAAADSVVSVLAALRAGELA